MSLPSAAPTLSRLHVKAFHSHTQPSMGLIRNRDTAVIIRLNNSLSPGLSKNVPMVPPSLFAIHRRRRLPAHRASFLSPLKNKLSFVFQENSENYCFSPVPLKAVKYGKKGKQADRIDPIGRNKGCRVAIAERQSSRHCFLEIARQVVYLSAERVFLIFDVYPESTHSVRPVPSHLANRFYISLVRTRPLRNERFI